MGEIVRGECRSRRWWWLLDWMVGTEHQRQGLVMGTGSKLERVPPRLPRSHHPPEVPKRFECTSSRSLHIRKHGYHSEARLKSRRLVFDRFLTLAGTLHGTIDRHALGTNGHHRGRGRGVNGKFRIQAAEAAKIKFLDRHRLQSQNADMEGKNQMQYRP